MAPHRLPISAVPIAAFLLLLLLAAVEGLPYEVRYLRPGEPFPNHRGFEYQVPEQPSGHFPSGTKPRSEDKYIFIDVDSPGASNVKSELKKEKFKKEAFYDESEIPHHLPPRSAKLPYGIPRDSFQSFAPFATSYHFPPPFSSSLSSPFSSSLSSPFAFSRPSFLNFGGSFQPPTPPLFPPPSRPSFISAAPSPFASFGSHLSPGFGGPGFGSPSYPSFPAFGGPAFGSYGLGGPSFVSQGQFPPQRPFRLPSGGAPARPHFAPPAEGNYLVQENVSEMPHAMMPHAMMPQAMMPGQEIDYLPPAPPQGGEYATTPGSSAEGKELVEPVDPNFGIPTETQMATTQTNQVGEIAASAPAAIEKPTKKKKNVKGSKN